MPVATTTNGYLLRDLAQAALAAISTNQDQLNALNVFPVPDGDTGTNMTLTMRSIASDMAENASESVPATSEAMARGRVARRSWQQWPDHGATLSGTARRHD